MQIKSAALFEFLREVSRRPDPLSEYTGNVAGDSYDPEVAGFAIVAVPGSPQVCGWVPI